MKKPQTELTSAEWVVIKAIWDAEPCTAPEILSRVEPTTGWSYSTVRTIMDRMAAKGLLAAEKQGKVTRFKSLVSQKQAQRTELLQTLRTAFDGALTPMVQCMLEAGAVSARELAELEALLREKRKQNGKP